MHIEVIGQGPALVLIHGWALHGGVFAPLVDRLSAHLQLHLVDLPGHGASRDDTTPLRLPHVVNAIAAATPPAVWCGWSLGGLFALHAAATLPQVRALAMIAATPRFVRGEDWPHAVEPAVFEQLARTSRRTTAARWNASSRWMRWAPNTPARNCARCARCWSRAASPPLVRCRKACACWRTPICAAPWPSWASPACGWPASATGWSSARAMQAAAALTPGAQAHVIAQGGHAPFLGHTDRGGRAAATLCCRTALTCSGRASPIMYACLSPQD